MSSSPSTPYDWSHIEWPNQEDYSWYLFDSPDEVFEFLQKVQSHFDSIWSIENSQRLRYLVADIVSNDFVDIYKRLWKVQILSDHMILDGKEFPINKSKLNMRASGPKTIPPLACIRIIKILHMKIMKALWLR